MKIDRVTIDPHPAIASASADRMIRDEKGTETTDAVTFDGERNERERQFKQTDDSDSTEQENTESAPSKPKLPIPGKRLIDVVV